MPRMNILNAVEREAFDSPPVFNSFQRKQYFDFPSKLRRFASSLRSPAYRVGFLLSAGYSPRSILSGTELQSLAAGLEKLANLTTLDLSHWPLSLAGLEKLDKLTTLYLLGNRLRSLAGLEKLGNLTQDALLAPLGQGREAGTKHNRRFNPPYALMNLLK